MPSIRDEISDNTLWRSCLGELLGTCLLVIVGCGSCISGWDDAYKPTIVQIALAFGLIVATMVWCLAHISGGHINPAVTIAMLLTRKISVVKALLYMIAQCLGAILGAGILLGVTPALNRGALGVTMLHPNINQYQGFGVEFCVTFVLVFCVFATCDGQRSDIHGSRALSIGLSVTVCHLFAIKFTGSSMNPARSLGPAAVMMIWNDHWIYWCGPLLGGLSAGLLYDGVFAANASVQKTRDYLMTSNYEENVYDTDTRSKVKVRNDQYHTEEDAF